MADDNKVWDVGVEGNKNLIREFEDKIVMEGEWVSEVVYDVMYSGTDNKDLFDSLYEIIGDYLGNPAEPFYQGALFTTVIERKSDGKLFGYSRWDSIGKHSESPKSEPNGDEYGFESTFNDDFTEYLTGPFWVWFPVREFSITGYEIMTPDKEK